MYETRPQRFNFDCTLISHSAKLCQCNCQHDRESVIVRSQKYANFDRFWNFEKVNEVRNTLSHSFDIQNTLSKSSKKSFYFLKVSTSIKIGIPYDFVRLYDIAQFCIWYQVGPQLLVHFCEPGFAASQYDKLSRTRTTIRPIEWWNLFVLRNTSKDHISSFGDLQYR